LITINRPLDWLGLQKLEMTDFMELCEVHIVNPYNHC